MLDWLYLIEYEQRGGGSMSERIWMIDDEQDLEDLLEVYLQNEN